MILTMCWTLHARQVANRNVGVSYTESQALGPASEDGSKSKAEPILATNHLV